jgi:hypothetical protein
MELIRGEENGTAFAKTSSNTQMWKMFSVAKGMIFLKL